jgi:predicted nucleotidyltransferase
MFAFNNESKLPRIPPGTPMSQIQEILRRKESRREKLASSLASISGQLARMGAKKILLFGSLAVDEVDVTSDLDLLVIMPSSRPGKDWMREIYEVVDRGVASDILVYNEEEFQADLSVNTFLRHIVSSGRVIYEKTA